jgi:hypothetical protein
MTKVRTDRLSLKEMEGRVVGVARDAKDTRERVADLEKENAALRKQLDAMAPPAGPSIPADCEMDERTGYVFSTARGGYAEQGKCRGRVIQGVFVEGFPIDSELRAKDGSVRKYPFAELMGWVRGGKFVARDLAAERAETAAAQADAAAKHKAEDDRIMKERHNGEWTDVWGERRRGNGYLDRAS